MSSFNTWNSFYSPDRRERIFTPKCYQRLSFNAKIFSNGSIPERLQTLSDTPFSPWLLAGVTGGRVNVHLYHHLLIPLQYQGDPSAASSVFMLQGSSDSLLVSELNASCLRMITDPGDPINTPTFESLFDDDVLEAEDVSKILGLQADDKTFLKMSALIPIPPFAFAIIDKFAPGRNIKDMLFSIMRALSTWDVQYGSNIPCQDIKAASFQLVQFLWILATTGDPASSAVQKFIQSFPDVPVVLVKEDVPKETLMDFESIISQDPTPDGVPPLMTNVLQELLQTIQTTSAHSSEQSKAFIEALHKHSEETSRVGFHKLLEETQRMLLRLATDNDGNVPSQPSRFMLKLYGDKKDMAHKILQAAFDSRGSTYSIPKSLAMHIHLGDFTSKIRGEGVRVSVMAFAATAEIYNTDESMILDMKLADTNISDDTYKKACTLKLDFPSSVDALSTSLYDMAMLFDVLGGYDGDDDNACYFSHRLRYLAYEIKQRTKQIMAFMVTDQDYLAHLSNAIDALINRHMTACRDSTSLSLRYANKLGDFLDSIDSEAGIQTAIPHCLVSRLPSKRKYGGGNDGPSPKHHHSGDGGGNGGGGNGGGNGGSSSFASKAGGTNPNPDPALTISKDYNVVFPPDCWTKVPKVSIKGKQVALCLKFYCLNKCTIKKCNRAHVNLNGAKMIELKAFVKIQKEAAGGA
ncbi:hypothetical protein MPSEU_000319000 [Mayamaea pseudoterrestris]|nr:hypothetical protein MPSEU_000319000 [Mayamaea pseudoterrestris]